MRPTWHLDSLAAVDAGFLGTHGIRGIIWDVDGTLSGDRRPNLDPRAAPAFTALLGLAELRHVVLSNSGEQRFVELGGMFPGVPILRAYARGGEVLYRVRRGAEDTWSAAELERELARGASM